MKFNLFRKPKQPEAEKPAETKADTTVASEETKQQSPILPSEPSPEPQPTLVLKPEPATPVQENITTASTHEEKQETLSEPASKTYLKAMPLKELADLENVKNEVKNGNIIILRVTPLATKSIEDVKTAVNQLYEYAESTGGDIARLGEERVVICPKNIRIWREKSPISTNSMPTAAPTAA
jgi:uncharacterized protein